MSGLTGFVSVARVQDTGTERLVGGGTTGCSCCTDMIWHSAVERPMGVPPLEGAAPPPQCEAGRLCRVSHLNAETMSWFRSCIAVLLWAYVWGLEPGGGAWALPDYAHLEGRLKKTPARVRLTATPAC